MCFWFEDGDGHPDGVTQACQYHSDGGQIARHSSGNDWLFGEWSFGRMLCIEMSDGSLVYLEFVVIIIVLEVQFERLYVDWAWPN